MGLIELADDNDLHEPEPVGGPDHPMRAVTREVAFEAGWSAGRARKVAELFDGLAEGWAARPDDPVKQAPILDGLARGSVNLDGQWLELGSGAGAGTMALRRRVDRVVAADLSLEMLLNAPAELAPRIRADAARLPFADDRFDGILMVNMLLFPNEVDRVLAPGGTLLWVNTLGDRTPIHLSGEELLAALPGSWSGSTARSGSGFWAAVGRDVDQP
ncbi:MAG: class I SAM-dependent methyltransferase [Actinomycetota bacterium]